MYKVTEEELAEMTDIENKYEASKIVMTDAVKTCIEATAKYVAMKEDLWNKILERLGIQNENRTWNLNKLTGEISHDDSDPNPSLN